MLLYASRWKHTHTNMHCTYIYIYVCRYTSLSLFLFFPLTGVRCCQQLIHRLFHLPLSLVFFFQSPSSPAFFTSLLTQSSHLSFGLPRLLLPFSRNSAALFGSQSSAILSTCPAHCSLLLTSLSVNIYVCYCTFMSQSLSFSLCTQLPIMSQAYLLLHVHSCHSLTACVWLASHGAVTCLTCVLLFLAGPGNKGAPPSGSLCATQLDPPTKHHQRSHYFIFECSQQFLIKQRAFTQDNHNILVIHVFAERVLLHVLYKAHALSIQTWLTTSTPLIYNAYKHG